LESCKKNEKASNLLRKACSQKLGPAMVSIFGGVAETPSLRDEAMVTKQAPSGWDLKKSNPRRKSIGRRGYFTKKLEEEDMETETIYTIEALLFIEKHGEEVASSYICHYCGGKGYVGESQERECPDCGGHGLY